MEGVSTSLRRLFAHFGPATCLTQRSMSEMAILQQLSEFSAEIGIAATAMRLVLQDNSRHFDHTKCSPADRPPPLPG
jgi:hypothetical protein